MSGGRILVVSQWWPRAQESAGSQRFVELLRLLARERIVDLWVERDEGQAPVRASAADMPAPRAALEQLGLNTLASGWQSLADALWRRRYDAALFEFHATARRYAGHVRRAQPAARVIVDSVDIHFARLAGTPGLGRARRGMASWTRRRELTAYRAADAILVCSAEDEQLLAAADLPPRFVIPIIVPPRPRAAGLRGPEVIFIGHFAHAPNRDGLAWFAREIWPAVRSAMPAARLRVAGSGSSAAAAALGRIDGLERVGWVDDTGPLLDRAAVAIAPIRYGSGMSGKVCGAMASGVAVVATSVAARGLDAVDGRELRIADRPADFARAVIDLLTDRAENERLGCAGRGHIARRLAPEIVAARVAAMLAAVESRRSARSRPDGSRGLAAAAGLAVFAAWHSALRALRMVRERAERAARRAAR